MSDEQKYPEGEEKGLPPDDTRPTRRPGDKPARSGEKQEEGEETETISLLDLMAEAQAEKWGEVEGASGAAQAEEDEEATDPDQATPTGPPIPTNLSRRKSRPLPPLAQDKTITSRPPEEDTDATRVDPDVAFPGSTDLQIGKRSRRQDEEAGAKRPPADARPKRRPRREVPRAEAPTEVFRRERPEARERRLPPPRRQPRRQQPRSARVAMPQPRSRPAARSRPRRNWRGCATRLLLVGLLLLVVGGALGMGALVVGYTTIAADLPPASTLQGSSFETAIIYDRNGNELYSLADPNTGNRTYVPLDEISVHLRNATIATEDARFYSNPGFDPVGIARSIVQAAREREFVSGASTITQQLVRARLLDDDERTQRTFRRKVREIILAAELARTYPKDKILELYLNEIYYGNLAYGIEAASQNYFNKPAADLTLAEASLLAGLPQAPALWDPYTAPELALGRQTEVLGLMAQAGYITAEEAQATIESSAPVVRSLEPPRRSINHPHFVFTVLQQLEDLLGAQSIYAGGLRVHTTLDPDAQQIAEEVVSAYEDEIHAAGANNASLVALDPQTGGVLALVGSLDFNDEAIRGQVNMALAPRQPGSAIKPFVYASAMEEGWTPATLIWDVRTEFADGANPAYIPKNYDDEYHGPLRLRPALGNSYNVPAVKALEYVGVCDFIYDLQEVGIFLDTSGCPPAEAVDDIERPTNFGLALALGGGEISPLRMTSAFGTLANEGHHIPPFTIARIENSRGEIQFEYAPPAAPPPQERAIRPAHAFLLSHILSDNEARRPEFSPNNLLVIPGHQVAAKTGTSGTDRFDVRDGWTIGYTPQIAAGVWVGNTDPVPVAEGMSGYRMATPLWNTFMTRYLSNRQPQPFTRPESVVDLEICAASGARPGPGCERQLVELFAADQLPAEAEEDFVQQVPVDLWTLQVANEYCEEAVYPARFFSLQASGRPETVPREVANAREWIEDTAAGRAWADAQGVAVPLRLPPTDECEPDTPRPEVTIAQPADGSEVTGEVAVSGRAVAPNFSGYRLEYGLSHDPGGWGRLEGGSQPVQGGELGRWDTAATEHNGPAALRVLVFGPDNPFTEVEDRVQAEALVRLTLRQPTPTPTPTPTNTPTPTDTPVPTDTPPPTDTPEPTDVPSPTLTPTQAISVTLDVQPTATPGGTPDSP